MAYEWHEDAWDAIGTAFTVGNCLNHDCELREHVHSIHSIVKIENEVGSLKVEGQTFHQVELVPRPQQP